MSKYYGDFRSIDYSELLATKPTILGRYHFLGQDVVLCEHPTNGEDSPIIAYVQSQQVAWSTGSFDMEDLTECGSDYQQYFDVINQVVKCSFELDVNVEVID